MRFCPGLGCTVCGPASGAAEPVPGGQQQGGLFRLRHSLLGNTLFVNIDRKLFCAIQCFILSLQASILESTALDSSSFSL
jgi:hypothetical protein